MAPTPFRHPADTLAFTNETVWRYSRDPATGRQLHERRRPEPGYTHRCFVMTRAVKLFHAHARFEPAETGVDSKELRRRVRSVLARNPRSISAQADRVIIPGFTNLRVLSGAFPDLVKAEAGPAWRSYFQRGHWRMVLPFTRRGQAAEAARLWQGVQAGRAVGVHVFTFPALTLNHSLVLFAARELPDQLEFQAYDPNAPDEAARLVFDRARREFSLPPLAYFIGGPVTVYEVYCGWLR